MSNFSFSHSVFKRCLLETHKNQGLFGKGLKLILAYLKVATNPAGINLPEFMNRMPINTINTELVPERFTRPLLKQRAWPCSSEVGWLYQGFNATLTAKVVSWRSVTHMCFLAFSHQY